MSFLNHARGITTLDPEVRVIVDDTVVTLAKERRQRPQQRRGAGKLERGGVAGQVKTSQA